MVALTKDRWIGHFADGTGRRFRQLYLMDAGRLILLGVLVALAWRSSNVLLLLFLAASLPPHRG